jgi:hypothetical protein
MSLNPLANGICQYHKCSHTQNNSFQAARRAFAFQGVGVEKNQVLRWKLCLSHAITCRKLRY